MARRPEARTFLGVEPLEDRVAPASDFFLKNDSIKGMVRDNGPTREAQLPSFSFGINSGQPRSNAQPGPYLRFELENTLIPSYNSSGDRPMESLSINFTQAPQDLRPQGASKPDTLSRAEVVPWLWFLTRAHTGPSTPSRASLSGEHYPRAMFAMGLLVSFEYLMVRPAAPLTGPPQAGLHSVQYRETALNFVSRLMEEEGIFYDFQQTGANHQVTGGAPVLAVWNPWDVNPGRLPLQGEGFA